eukprot:s1818_g20.t1
MEGRSIVVSEDGTENEVVRIGCKFGYPSDLMLLSNRAPRQEIGSGAAAKVYVCRRLRTGEELAVKVINLAKLMLMDYGSRIIESAASPMAAAEEEQQSGNVVLYVVVGIYIALLICIAKVAHARKQRESAALGKVKAHFSGSYGSFVLMLTTFSTVYSGFTVTGIPDEAFAKGFANFSERGSKVRA